MLQVIIGVAALAAHAFALPVHLSGSTNLASYSFDSYILDFGKAYSTAAEEAIHRAIYEAKVAQILSHNANTNATFKKGINKFTDMSEAEINRYKGKRPAKVDSLLRFIEPPADFMANLKPVSELPSSIDWRAKGACSPVKDQGGCGSCWAFSATEVLESHVQIATGKLLQLAPQELVDCAPNPDDCGGTGGCSGSTQWLGFNYTQHAGGLSLESSYSYVGATQKCQKAKVKPAAGNKGYVRLPANNYTVLMNAVATLGPVAISLDANFMEYSSGVFSASCGAEIDHAVVLDGYGTEGGVDYYLVRNSWGADWGERGYIKIERRSDDSTNCEVNTSPASGTECKPYPKTQTVCGLCGILSDSSYPTDAFVV